MVVFHSPVNEDEDLVKRVVAVAGDRVAVKDGTLYVNGVAQEEPYLLEQDFEGDVAGDRSSRRVKSSCMGDNRNNSGDSRFFGPIDDRLDHRERLRRSTGPSATGEGCSSADRLPTGGPV